MCGIAGFMNKGELDVSATKAIANAMGDAIRHRGPDSGDMWMDAQKGICLIHRRLAIIDLSQAGHQPMVSADGRYQLVFNGEIYNHSDLRRETQRAGWCSGWRGNSDTETLLACIQTFGFVATLKKLVGMFAIAVFDRERDCVFLARDRMGEKPLYYGTQGNISFFASELKAIRGTPSLRAHRR